MLAKLSSASTMSDASRVTSVPASPIAIPMWAAESRSIVDAVTGHRHDRAAGLPLTDDPNFVFRRRARVDASLERITWSVRA